MPVEVTDEELYNAYSNRCEQLKQEKIGHVLRVAEIQRDTTIDDKETDKLVKQHQAAMRTIDNAYDAAKSLLVPVEQRLESKREEDEDGSTRSDDLAGGDSGESTVGAGEVASGEVRVAKDPIE